MRYTHSHAERERIDGVRAPLAPRARLPRRAARVLLAEEDEGGFLAAARRVGVRARETIGAVRSFGRKRREERRTRGIGRGHVDAEAALVAAHRDCDVPAVAPIAPRVLDLPGACVPIDVVGEAGDEHAMVEIETAALTAESPAIVVHKVVARSIYRYAHRLLRDRFAQGVRIVRRHVLVPGDGGDGAVRLNGVALFVKRLVRVLLPRVEPAVRDDPLER
mmetsp:Transcript_14506/g.47645  ORF Transcript_14506/g.47645 Transcript_14506/m.47645 type:complete len:220 (+) Transcript_14506:574-1233(+)